MSSSAGHPPVTIISDSVTAISRKMADDNGIRLVTLFVNEGGLKYADATMDIDGFYSRIGQMTDPLPTSSQPARGEVLTVSYGETTVFEKVRTYSRALALMASTFEEEAWSREAIQPVVGHAVDVIPVSPVIGSHVGPAVGIAYQCLSALPGKAAMVPEFSV